MESVTINECKWTPVLKSRKGKKVQNACDVVRLTQMIDNSSSGSGTNSLKQGKCGMSNVVKSLACTYKRFDIQLDTYHNLKSKFFKLQ